MKTEKAQAAAEMSEQQQNVEQFKQQYKTVPTLTHVINGQYVPTDTEREQLSELLGSGCQAKNKRVIRSVCMYGLSNLPNWGIMGRVQFEGDRVKYCAGQSYPDEIRTVRKAFTDRG